MDHRMSDSDAMMTDGECPTCSSRYATTDSLRSQFARLETRMDRIEGNLSKILDRLPVESSEDRGKKRKLNVPPREDEDNSSFGDEKRNHGQQHPGQKINRTHIMNRQYSYTPLDISQSQIRMLKLHPASRFIDPLVASLSVVNLDDDDDTSNFGGLFGSGYSALSYTWGPAVFDGVIMIDGCWFTITKSLEAALRQLRSVKSSGFGNSNHYWVDQICINQTDLDERSNQVNLMRRIYKKAGSVQVWLGEEADDSALAIHILKKIGVSPRHAPGERPIQYPSFTEEEIMRHWDALRALFKRPWWQRVWIRQEIALHRSVELWCGSKNFDMATLRPALSMLAQISTLGYRSSISCSDDDTTVVLPWDFHARKLIQLKDLTCDGSSWVGLAQLLRIIRACEATDARDMVYSVLGLADPEIYPIVPDYRREIKQIFLSATQIALGQRYGLEILGACQNPEKKHGLPSWVPLLSDKWRAMPFQSMAAEKTAFAASQFLTKAERPEIKVEGEVLALRGGLVDTVASICKQFAGNNSNAGDMETVYSSWKIFAEHASMQVKLSDRDSKKFVESREPERTDNWIRFITARIDDNSDARTPFASFGNFNGFGKFNFAGGLFSQTEPNPKLARSYLLPSSYDSAEPLPNHKINAGLQAYGVGRRLGITSRGFLALVPAETHIGDNIALFQGATYPYVLRKAKEHRHHVLVGEAFIPGWNTKVEEAGIAETLSKAGSKVNLNSWVRIY